MSPKWTFDCIIKELVSPQTWQSRRICTHFPSGNHQNHNQVLNSHRPKRLESTPPDTFKDKEEATRDGRRGAFTTQSNPMSTRWAAHRLEGNYITEVPSQDQVLSPTSCSPAWRSSPARRVPRAFGLEGQWGLSTGLELHGTGGDRVHSWRAQTRFCATGSQPRLVNSIGAGTGPPVGPRGSPVVTGVGCGSLGRGKGKDSGGRSPQRILTSPRGRHFGIKTWL